MKLKILAFGITKEIFGNRQFETEVPAGFSAKDLLDKLKTEEPKLAALRSLALAVNGNYAEENLTLKETDELALIPPVSGG